MNSFCRATTPGPGLLSAPPWRASSQYSSGFSSMIAKYAPTASRMRAMAGPSAVSAGTSRS